MKKNHVQKKKEDRNTQIQNEIHNIQSRIMSLEEMGDYDSEEIYQLENRHDELMDLLPPELQEVVSNRRSLNRDDFKQLGVDDDKTNKKDDETTKKNSNSTI